VEKGGRKSILQRGMEEAPENSKESSHSAHANGRKEGMYRTVGSELVVAHVLEDPTASVFWVEDGGSVCV
jgi:hypothetical protein